MIFSIIEYTDIIIINKNFFAFYIIRKIIFINY